MVTLFVVCAGAVDISMSNSWNFCRTNRDKIVSRKIKLAEPHQIIRDFSSVFEKTRDLVWNEFGSVRFKEKQFVSSDIVVIYYFCNSRVQQLIYSNC